MGFNCLKARGTSRRQFTFTTNSPEIPGTHFIDSEGWKAEPVVCFGAPWDTFLFLKKEKMNTYFFSFLIRKNHHNNKLFQKS